MDDTSETVVQLVVDGTTHRPQAKPDRFLSDVLRNELGLVTVKEACTEGECGSCTVMVGGQALDSCIYPVGLVGDRPIETAQSNGDPLFDMVREALLKGGAIQCGFCTPGIVTAAVALLRENPTPDAEQVRAGLAGNLCRCTGYQPIIGALVGGVARGGDRDDDD
jgi:aerobic-type carbon monoxide dehydrogenase small subunit (CoxS/CutS family)